ncbi:hypothetical protein [Cellulomonas denverensis]|uniref:Uncharacterized protein n=1 Tax=Cellulomonas denverensis TaxID=264297 RepID=A0A7X6KUC3_9CELL|nr:hypothetical protein [Cellulomonas denverensis]NKY22409.1 hypothetical protein [Cellulomonas denverensis]GIG27359.1 hypothetical protein Cde04nite_36030 [Cellulomonas denverensis]
MIGDRLLSWMSATGSGSVRDLRRRVQWMARTSDADHSAQAAARWVRDMSTLGHCEVDWQADRWSIAPPALAVLPCSDGRAALVGSRRAALLDRLEGSSLWIEHLVQEPSGDDLPLPTTVLVSYDSYDSLAAEAVRIGAAFGGCAAVRLAARVPRVVHGAAAAPPPWSSTTLERFEGLSRPYFRPEAIPAGGRARDGLYRMEVLGRHAYLLMRDGAWHHCGRAEGVYLELARWGETTLRYRPDAAGYPESGSLFVDWGAPLPLLQARALVLCSGKVPRFGQAGQTTIYGNVPVKVAHLVADTLMQKLVML